MDEHHAPNRITLARMQEELLEELKALRVENRRLVAMLDALPDFLLLQDVEGRYLFLNRAAREIVSALTGVP